MLNLTVKKREAMLAVTKTGEGPMRIAVCDDEKVCRDRISGFLKPYQENYPQITVNEFCSGEELIHAYENGEFFDILFLDIQMEAIDGIGTAQKIRETDKNAIIIFITSYVAFVSQTFRAGAFQFLVKPVEQAEFNRDFERAIESYKKSHYKYSLRSKEGTTSIEINGIYYIEIYRKHLFVFAENCKYECVGTLAEEEKKLKGYNFVLCHKSFLVNMRYIRLIGTDSIELTNGMEIPLSRSYKANVKVTFNDYILECSV